MAGLAAADALSAEGASVVVLEARDRIGGRIHTIPSRRKAIPIELGAEFVHGAKNETWRLIHAAGLATHEVPDSHWQATDGVLVRNPQFWDQLAKAMENIYLSAPDQDFASYLASQMRLDDFSRALAIEYVEGFHAAPPDCMSVHALKKAEKRAEVEEGTRAFRLAHGYSGLTEWLASRINSRGSRILCDQNVRIVRWKRGRVEIIAETPKGVQKHHGSAAIITLPLGVLQAAPEEGVFFDPELAGKRTPIMSLRMGRVIKVVLQFDRRLWPIDNFGFIHSSGQLFPVWWSDERGPVLTGWTGDGRAEWLSRENQNAIFAEAVNCLGRILNLTAGFLKKRLQAEYFHDWSADPFSRGAYSFTPPRMTRMAGRLAEPLSNTLFFAGEATDSEGNQGTVQGALTSGERVADQVLRTMKKKERLAVR